MGDGEPWIAAVAAAARTFRERLGAGDAEVWTAQVERVWLDAVAQGRDDWLLRRRAWSGVQATEGAPDSSDDRDDPSWVEVAAEISRATAEAEPGAASPEASAAAPFAALLAPVVGVARRRLAVRAGGSCRAGVDASPMAHLEADLYERLVAVTGRVLHSELTRVRRPGRAFLRAVGAAPPAGRDVYDRFVEAHRSSGWRVLFERYPMLARLMATTVLWWVEASRELLERLAADRADLSRLGVAAAAAVTAFEPSVSDRHRGGRTAVIVTFEGGARVVYKPKPLQAEALVAATIDALNARGLTPHLTPVAVLARDGYGWAAFVEHKTCASPAEVRSYFTRAGMLLCLLHVLRATDAHYENIVAAGDHPVLVDCETILYPDPRPLLPRPGADGSEAWESVAATVLRTGLLPSWQEADGRPYDSSGLCGLDGSTETVATWRWIDPGTDDARLELVPQPPSTHNRVILDGRPVAAVEHADEVVDGFNRCYDLLLRCRDGLIAPGGPLHDTRGVPIRFIFRPTRVYGAVLAGSLTPDVLRDGLAFGLHLDALAAAFVSLEERPPSWPVLAAETRALERLDVPLFTLQAGATGLTLDDGTALDDVFASDTTLGAAAALEVLSAEDRTRQAGLIAAAFAAKAARLPEEPAHARSLDPEGHPWDGDAVVELARRIGDGLLDSALPAGDGALTWVGPSLLESIGRYRLNLVGGGLYDGTSGIATFLAALARITGESRFGEGALAALQGVRQRIHRGSGRGDAYDFLGLGMATGLGGELFALASVHRSLGGADGLAEDSVGLASLALPAALASDESFDVMSGSAGALLGLLALYELTGSGPVLAHAVAAGDHLLERRTLIGDHRVWVTVSGRALTGFSHGAAGIAYALARLHAACAGPRFRDAALEAVGYERARFDMAQGNWPDLRPAGSRHPSGFCVKWCHGAAGIGIGRAGMLRYGPLDGAREEIEVAVRTTTEQLVQPQDHLCCGNFGRIEALLVASQAMPDTPWRERARAAAATIVHDRRCNGFHVNGLGERENPSFFQGMSGIGYQLLRLAQPDLPSVLLLE